MDMLAILVLLVWIVSIVVVTGIVILTFLVQGILAAIHMAFGGDFEFPH